VSIFPNPVTDYALISVSAAIKDGGEIEFELYDLTGKMLIKKNLSQLNVLGDNVFKFEKGNLAPGTYLYRAMHQSEISAEGRLVIQ